ncbi:uncharacterized protein LOC123524624 [Mercenaria mercenaria]|uniref:uncharacterized protein LOC123524624 n=1 Tax=Mercenaria mercenaria TaxID=6596 RepID=UPI00234EF35D|nr:uncharacterized protein LOC123524624 [Mercenaria mercenaria]
MRNNRASYVRVEFDQTEEIVTLQEELNGPEEAVALQEELDGPERAVTVQEERNSAVNSNEQLVENNIEENLTRTNSNCRRTCNILKRCFVVVLVAALVIVIIVLLAERNREHPEWSPGPQASRSPGPQASRLSSYLDADDRIDDSYLRISTENSSCVGPSCVICKADVMPYLEPGDCARSHANVKNGSCFLCGQKCLKLQDLLNKVKQKGTHVMCRGQPPVELNCCVLSIMGNHSNYCGEGGQYLCYQEAVHAHHNQSVNEPVCWCPSGNMSEHCNKPYTEEARCRCFKSSRKFCGQEEITQCDKVKTSWKTCHMNRTELGEQYNCLCDKSTDNRSSDHLVRCSLSDSNPNSTYAFD